MTKTVKQVVDAYLEKQDGQKYDYEWILAIITNGYNSHCNERYYNVNNVVEKVGDFEFTEYDKNGAHRRRVEGRIIDRSSLIEE